MDDDRQQDEENVKTIKASEEEFKDGENKEEGMDIDSIRNLWIKTMHLAGCENQQITEMFDDNGGINKNINGWIMHIDEQKDTKDASSINRSLQHIYEVKPLLIHVDASKTPKHVINRVAERQNHQPRFVLDQK